MPREVERILEGQLDVRPKRRVRDWLIPLLDPFEEGSYVRAAGGEVEAHLLVPMWPLVPPIKNGQDLSVFGLEEFAVVDALQTLKGDRLRLVLGVARGRSDVEVLRLAVASRTSAIASRISGPSAVT